MEREDFCPHCQGKGYIEDDLHDEPCYECEGGFTTEMLGIPANAAPGMWQIKAQSGLDHKEQIITVLANSNE